MTLFLTSLSSQLACLSWQVTVQDLSMIVRNWTASMVQTTSMTAGLSSVMQHDSNTYIHMSHVAANCSVYAYHLYACNTIVCADQESNTYLHRARFCQDVVHGSSKPARNLAQVTEMGSPTLALQGSALAGSIASAPHMQSTLLAAGDCSKSPVQSRENKDPNSFQPRKGWVYRGARICPSRCHHTHCKLCTMIVTAAKHQDVS